MTVSRLERAFGLSLLAIAARIARKKPKERKSADHRQA